MNYIYDILLNFKECFYDFYDWNMEDSITHIRKTPTFKVSSKCLFDLKNNRVKIDEIFLSKIFNKTEQFKKSEVIRVKYAAIFSDGKDILAIKFSKNGMNSLKSTLAIDEQDDIIEIIKYQKEISLNYKIIKKQRRECFKTRFEIENENFIMDELMKMYNENDYKKLSYICLECFGKSESNIDLAMNKIKKEITKGNDNFYKIFDIFKMTIQK